MKASQLVTLVPGDFLATLGSCGAFYQTPKDESGKRLGPLVGYAGKYTDATTNETKQLVGEVYFNFARAEQYPAVIDLFAAELASKATQLVGAVDYVLGPAMGGIVLAAAVARQLDARFLFSEKKVLSVTTEQGRGEEAMIISRHQLAPNSRVLLIEDVCNNFSTTGKVVRLVREKGADIVAVGCAINSSGKTEIEVEATNLPVLAVVPYVTQKFHQDDPAVVEDIAAGNIFWKPKEQWDKLISFTSK